MVLNLTQFDHPQLYPTILYFLSDIEQFVAPSCFFRFFPVFQVSCLILGSYLLSLLKASIGWRLPFMCNIPSLLHFCAGNPESPRLHGASLSLIKASPTTMNFLFVFKIFNELGIYRHEQIQPVTTTSTMTPGAPPLDRSPYSCKTGRAKSLKPENSRLTVIHLLRILRSNL